MTIFPGLLIYKRANYRGSTIQKATFIFGTSLIINYIGVFFLTSIKLYTQATLISVFILEAILFFILLKKGFASVSTGIFSEYLANLKKILEKGISSINRQSEEPILFFLKLFLTVFSITLALMGIWWALKLFFYNIGSIFNAWDAIASWNRWATEWAGNSFPVDSARYPQLIPANWSLSYVFIGNIDIQFFAKAITPLFTLFILLMLFDLGISTKKPGYFIGVFLTYLMIKKFVTVHSPPKRKASVNG